MLRRVYLPLLCLLLILPLGTLAAQAGGTTDEVIIMAPSAHHQHGTTNAGQCAPKPNGCDIECWQCPCACCHLTAPPSRFELLFGATVPIIGSSGTPADIQRPRVPELPPPLA